MSAVLSVSSLAKRYSGPRHGDPRAALAGVSFELGSGELVALVGPNGAGKTTLLSIIAGVQTPSAGDVAHAGGRPAGWVPQVPAVYTRLTVAENLELFARLEGLPEREDTVTRMLERAGLAERRDDPVAQLSGGNRQRLNVALGLLGDPPLLALDEPSVALDPAQRERLWELLAARVETGTTVLFSTHNVAEAQSRATRVLVLADGRLLFDGTPEELLEEGGEDAAGDLERALVRFLRARLG